MIRNTVRAVCPHGFLIVKRMDSTRSVEVSRCEECGTSLIRPTVPLRDASNEMTSDPMTYSQRPSSPRNVAIVFGSIYPPPP